MPRVGMKIRLSLGNSLPLDLIPERSFLEELFALGITAAYLPTADKITDEGGGAVSSLASTQADGGADQALTDQGNATWRPQWAAQGSTSTLVPSLTFNGSTNILEQLTGSNTTIGNAAHTIFELFKPTTVATNDITFRWVSNIQAQAFNAVARYRYITGSANPVVSDVTVTSATVYCGMLGHDGTDAHVGVSGGTDSSATGALAGTMDRLAIGARASGTQAFHGEWFGLFLADAWLSSENRANIRSLLEAYVGV